jgi:hypothetical protein
MSNEVFWVESSAEWLVVVEEESLRRPKAVTVAGDQRSL